LTTPTGIADPDVVHSALLAYGGWTIIIVVGAIVMIGLAIYSVFALRKEDAWEERPPADQDWPED
jgi:flagellar basal body-associated protein FliL